MKKILGLRDPQGARSLMFMIMLIENDVVIEDDFDNNWIWDDVGVYDNIDMRWCY